MYSRSVLKQCLKVPQVALDQLCSIMSGNGGSIALLTNCVVKPSLKLDKLFKVWPLQVKPLDQTTDDERPDIFDLIVNHNSDCVIIGMQHLKTVTKLLHFWLRLGLTTALLSFFAFGLGLGNGFTSSALWTMLTDIIQDRLKKRLKTCSKDTTLTSHLGSLLSNHLAKTFIRERIASHDQFLQLPTLGQFTGDVCDLVFGNIQLFQSWQCAVIFKK